MEDFNLHKEVTDKYSLRGRVFNKIREDILAGVYKENEELKENTIGLELGVSRTPVREALRQLELEGLVTIIPNKGAYVTGITSKDIHDIYMIRSYLEGLCAKWACDHITEAQIEALDEVLYLSDFHARRGHNEQLVELDNKFHELIYKASGSKILEHVLTDFHHYVERVRKITLSRPSRATKSSAEHAAILDAIRRRDGKLAEALANEHIMNTIQNISDQGL
ncbi:GntR family transcriptional regulator [Lachnospiraceae bacterium MD1]|uniref:GntR family transcriptional regulator n=1 Tax=Variimorphobacter saccharofermentans TaxID=2755051 RepID=A0A839K0Z4_9FIRM|nr:GntR family transcriptional regulator [Variimorphobacter saccharofermentans]MBB2182599.1 GntR family transcriptional regulator [Variimorphobacter saccharofermentans]